MKKLLTIAFLVSSFSVFANCAQEVRTAAINYRASSSPSNVDFVADARQLAHRGDKYYYFVQVDVSDDSSAEDLSSWVVKIIAEAGSCRILSISL